MRYIAVAVLLLFTSLRSSAQAGQSGSVSRPIVVGRTYELQSAILSERRVLNVYLPEGYDKDDTTSYPVVYLLDGGLDEDFIHISGLYQFSSFPWVARVRPSIIVGIANTDRKRDMTYPTRDTADRRRFPGAGHSDRFIGFLEKELQPFVRKQFRTNGVSTLIGESLGGLLATEILLKRPAMFGNYIIVSPSLWWDDGSLLKVSTDGLRAAIRDSMSVYIGVGKEGVTPGDKPHVMEVDANVLADKIRGAKNGKLSLYFDYLPDEDHATVMHQAVLNALRMMGHAAGK